MSSQQSAPLGAPRASYRSGVHILIAGAALIAACRWLIAFDEGHAIMASFSALALTMVVFSYWFVRYSSAPRKIKLTWLVCLVGLVGCVEIKGCQGNLVPIVGWRWVKSPDQLLARAERRTTEAASVAVDLTKTTPHDYPGFLGADGLGVAPIDPFPAGGESPAAPKVVWRHPIGAGWSSFAVVGDFAVTQEQRGDEELVVCYEWRTFRERWRHSDPGRHETAMGGIGPRATPTLHQGLVLALGAEGRLNCLDGADGNVRWSRNVLSDHKARLPDWGKSCSPLVVGDRVIVSVGGDNGRALAAYRLGDGAPEWHSGDDETSYAAPVLGTLDGVEQIIMLNGASVTGHDPRSGSVLWRYDWPGLPPKVPQPIVLAPHDLLVSSGYGLGCKRLSVKRSGSQWQLTERWSTNKLRPKFTNLIVYDGHLFGLDDGISLACVELETGKVKWKQGRYGHGQLLRVGERLLIQAENGDVALVEASGTAYREQLRFPALDGRTWNNPVLLGNQLLVRNDREALLLEWPAQSVAKP